jgi:hypothetical protein
MGSFGSALCLVLVAGAGCASVVGFEGLEFDAPAATGDASSDAPVVVNDAAVDADGAEASKCLHDFCDDFEGITAPDERWSGKEVVGSGELSLVEEDGGANTVMRSSIGRPDASTTVHFARVSLQGPTPTKADGSTNKVKVAFRVKVESGEPDPFIASLTFIVIGTSPGMEDLLSIELARSASAPSLFEVRFVEIYGTDAGVAYAGKLSSLTIRQGEWTNLEFQINARPPGLGGGASLTIGGASDSYALASNSRPAYLRVDVGHGVGTLQGAAFTTSIDDVTIDHRE